MNLTEHILQGSKFGREEILHLLNVCGREEMQKIFGRAAEVKASVSGNYVYLRGLIEFSNWCSKNCYYCGIRSDNRKIFRYTLPERDILDAAVFAWKKGYGSLVMQSGEMSSRSFTARVTRLLQKIHEVTRGEMHITLSCGEQSGDVYREWFQAGAHRYLLRIETTNRALFRKIHPANARHSYDRRIECLQMLKDIGYQTGTGVMIGLPFQTVEDMAADLMFFRDFGVHMVGMGPYAEHADTPLYDYAGELMPVRDRVDYTLKMIAVLRIMLPSINIASATALQALDRYGREKGVQAGANVIMPNITPAMFRKNYQLYNGKPCLDDSPDHCSSCIDMRMKLIGHEIAYHEWGDPLEFTKGSGS